MKHLIGEKKDPRTMCFEISNWTDVDALDPFAVTNLEDVLPTLGALPGNSYVNAVGLTVYCVIVENPSLSAGEILKEFARFGFQAHALQDTY
jgi:hypothetical protein